MHIGDRYRIGEAEFEVTQPRVTCFRVGMRLGEPRMPSLLVAHHRPGFYLRVITEGHVEAGDEIVRTRTGRHELSVADVDALLYLPGRDAETLRKAVDIPALSPGWQGSFRDLLAAAPAPEPSGWRGFRPLRVERIVPESTTVASIHLAADDGAPLPRPVPGQYLTLRVPGAGDPAPVRSYSLSAGPSDSEYRISVKRDGVVSGYLHTRLKAGAVVDVAAPRGDFVLAGDDRPGAADLRGHRRHAGAGDAARARREPDRAGGLVAAHHPHGGRARVRRRGAPSCWRAFPTATKTSTTPRKTRHPAHPAPPTAG